MGKTIADGICRPVLAGNREAASDFNINGADSYTHQMKWTNTTLSL